jgi:hypothetical protein
MSSGSLETREIAELNAITTVAAIAEVVILIGSARLT